MNAVLGFSRWLWDVFWLLSPAATEPARAMESPALPARLEVAHLLRQVFTRTPSETQSLHLLALLHTHRIALTDGTVLAPAPLRDAARLVADLWQDNPRVQHDYAYWFWEWHKHLDEDEVRRKVEQADPVLDSVRAAIERHPLVAEVTYR